MVIELNLGHFIMYANVSLLYITPETNNVVCQLYINYNTIHKNNSKWV